MLLSNDHFDDGRLTRYARWSFLLALVAIVTRALLFIVFPGFLTGDDTEMLQEAMRFTGRIDYQPWVIRSQFLAWLISFPLRIALAMGIDHFSYLSFIAFVPFFVASGANIFLTFRVGERIDSARVGFIAALLLSLHWIPIVYGSSFYPRVIGTSFILFAALLVLPPPRNAASNNEVASDTATILRGSTAGLLLAAAFAVRFSEIVFVAVVVALLVSTQTAWKRVLLALAAGFVAGFVLFVGVFDWYSWGAPFESLRQFAHYTLVQKESSSVEKAQPALWYLVRSYQWFAPTLLPFLFWATPRTRRALLPGIVVALILLSVIHHKELRYLQALLPFLFVLAASGFVSEERRLPAGASESVSEETVGRGRALLLVLMVVSVIAHMTTVVRVAKKSGAALDAARVIAAERGSVVVLSQAWAYGNRLLLPEAAVIDPGTPPDLERLREVTDRASHVALYESEVTQEIREALAAAGFGVSRTFARNNSKRVTLFSR